MPADFEPVNTDGEVEAFYLWPIDKVLETVRETDEFKFNCAIVVIDFLIRHGILTPEDRDYDLLQHALRLEEHGLPD